MHKPKSLIMIEDEKIYNNNNGRPKASDKYIIRNSNSKGKGCGEGGEGGREASFS